MFSGKLVVGLGKGFGLGVNPGDSGKAFCGCAAGLAEGGNRIRSRARCPCHPEHWPDLRAGVMLGTPVAVSTSPFDRPRGVSEVEPLKVPSRPREKPGATRRRRSRGERRYPEAGSRGVPPSPRLRRTRKPLRRGEPKGKPDQRSGLQGERIASELAAYRGKRRRSRGSTFAKATARRESRSHSSERERVHGYGGERNREGSAFAEAFRRTRKSESRGKTRCDRAAVLAGRLKSQSPHRGFRPNY